MVELKHKWQYWHSCIVESLWKTRSEDHVRLAQCHLFIVCFSTLLFVYICLFKHRSFPEWKTRPWYHSIKQKIVKLIIESVLHSGKYGIFTKKWQLWNCKSSFNMTFETLDAIVIFTEPCVVRGKVMFSVVFVHGEISFRDTLETILWRNKRVPTPSQLRFYPIPTPAPRKDQSRRRSHPLLQALVKDMSASQNCAIV